MLKIIKCGKVINDYLATMDYFFITFSSQIKTKSNFQ